MLKNCPRLEKLKLSVQYIFYIESPIDSKIILSHVVFS